MPKDKTQSGKAGAVELEETELDEAQGGLIGFSPLQPAELVVKKKAAASGFVLPEIDDEVL